MKNNYIETLEAFQRDCCRQTKPNPRTQDDLKKDLLAVAVTWYSISIKVKDSNFSSNLHSSYQSPCARATPKPCASSSTSISTFSFSDCIPFWAKRRPRTRRQSKPSSTISKAEGPLSRNRHNSCNITLWPTCRNRNSIQCSRASSRGSGWHSSEKE